MTSWINEPWFFSIGKLEILLGNSLQNIMLEEDFFLSDLPFLQLQILRREL